jgi:outer membrane protein TolC
MNHFKKGNWCFLVFLILITRTLIAHGAEEQGLTLIDYYEGALITSPEFVRSAAEAKIDIESLSYGYQEYLPSISLSYGNSYIESDDSGAASSFSSQGDYRKKSMSGSIVQPLFDKQKISRVAYNRAKIDIVRSDLDLKKRDLLKEVFSIYRQYYLLQSEIELADHVENLRNKALKRISSAVEQGVGRDVDLISAKMSMLRASSELRRYKSKLNSLVEEFKQLTGFIEIPSREICTTNYNFLIPISSSKLPESLTISPELAQLQSNLELIRSERNIAQSELYPSLYLSYEKSRSSTINGTFDGSIENSSVSTLGVEIPILSGKGSYQRVKTASQKESVYQAAISRKKIDHIRFMSSLFYRYQEINEGFGELLSAYKLSQELLTVREKEFELGMIGVEDYDTAVNNHLELVVERDRYCMDLLEIRVLSAEETGRIDYLVME